MTTGSDFIPDYSYRTTAGIASTRNSKLLYTGKTAYISVYNRIHLWAIPSMEETDILGSGKAAISCFAISQDNTVIIGYENGLLELISDSGESTTIRLHRKRITQILPFSTGFISSSVDGSICQYDIMLGEHVVSYIGSPVSVERIALAGNKLLAVCADRSLRVWNSSEGDIVDIYTFDEDIFGVSSLFKSAFVVCRSGRSFIVDLEGRMKRPFETFKKVRNLVQKGDQVAIQMQKGFVVFRVVSETQPRLEVILRSEISDLFINFDIFEHNLLFISKKNAICMFSIKGLGENDASLIPATVNSSIITHSSDIIQMEVYNDLVYTLSEERLLVWDKMEEDEYEDVNDANRNENSFKISLKPIRWIELSKATCFCLFGDFIVIGRWTGFTVYLNGEIHNEITLGKVCSLSCHGDVLAVVVDAFVTFYDNMFDVIHELTSHEPIIFSGFAPCGTMFCVSTLDNKIGVYNFPDLNCRVSLYGHTLPVRSFAFTRDGKQLISCGADKVIKIWGLEFGECRKSIVANTQNAESVVRVGAHGECAENLFLFCDKDIKYYCNFNRLKSFKCFSSGIIKAGSDFFVASSERGVSLFTMNRHEYLEEDASEEIDHPLAGVVADTACYDEFLMYLEKLEDCWQDTTAKAFYEFLERTEAAELRTFLQILDSKDISVVLSMLLSSVGHNIILKSRIFVLLLEFHRDVLTTSSAFDTLRDDLLVGIRNCRDLCGRNEMRMLVEASKEEVAKE
ncbi:hypothetical protein PAEPH01_2034 [Pancytospora epiphaga]|nr:hypothetical protein PAEPH01_2034 [Pancytospora epiphaga]